MWHKSDWLVRRKNSLSLATTSSHKVYAMWCIRKWRKLHEVHHRKKPNLGRIKCWKKERHYSKNLACYTFVSLIMENFNTHWTVTNSTNLCLCLIHFYLPLPQQQSCIFSISFTFTANQAWNKCISIFLWMWQRWTHPITPVVLRTCHMHTLPQYTVDKHKFLQTSNCYCARLHIHRDEIKLQC